MIAIHTISTTQALEEKCAVWAEKPYITIDTEFLRTSTYWPELCLIQIGHAGAGWLIDPMAEGLDLTPLFDLLKNPSVLKVFHDARQDIEIIHHEAGFCPSPIFDTQMAAQACGFGDSASYEVLARELVGLAIDKSARVTDWSRRPLSEKQEHYALSDVTHLCRIYEKLQRELKKRGRIDWVEPEFASLTKPALYENPPEKAWRNLKLRPHGVAQQKMLEIIAAWRETQAQKLDRPRGWILRDEVMRSLMVAASRNGALAEVDNLPKKFLSSSAGAALRKSLEAAYRDLANAPDVAPPAKKQGKEKGKGKRNGVDNKISMLKLLLKIQCEHYDVAPRLIANTQDIETFVANPDEPSPFCQGFRKEVFGSAALSLIKGEISLTLVQGKMQIVKTRAP